MLFAIISAEIPPMVIITHESTADEAPAVSVN